MTTGTGLCLTFDDKFIEGWFSALELFERYNAKATFFVCWPHKLKQREKRLLRKIAAAGHEVGCHTLEHVRLPKFLQTGDFDDYVTQQIDPAIQAMQDMGFDPRSFSYPYFKYRPDLNDMLLEKFDVLRVEGPVSGFAKSVAPRFGNRRVDTFCYTDKTGMGLDIAYYVERFDHLRDHGGYGVTCGHSIGDFMPKNPKMRCSLEDLEIILALAHGYGFDFVTMSELAQDAPVAQAA